MEEANEEVFEIYEDCMWSREYFEWVPTRWLCGCCHADVDRTDTKCWHCNSKLIPKSEKIPRYSYSSLR